MTDIEQKLAAILKCLPPNTQFKADVRVVHAEVLNEIARLRAALVGLIGADGEDDLRQMEAAMRMLPVPEEDKAVSINAIHALLATMTTNAQPTDAKD